MAQQSRLGTVATHVSREDGVLTVRYHGTRVVEVYPNGKVILNSNGYRTSTTKTRMNQASTQFRLGFHVWQQNFAWFVDVDGHTLEFRDGMAIRNGADVAP